MDSDLKASNERRLVYREGPYLLFGLPLTILGLAGAYGTGTKLFSSWPDDAVAQIGGLLGCATMLAVLAVGLRSLICRKVLLDKTARQIIRSCQLLFWRRLTTMPFSEFTSVRWKPRWEFGYAKYVIQLSVREGNVELFQVQRIDDARRITCQIGEFLHLKQEHWDDAILKAEESREPHRARTMTRVIWSIVQRQPMRCVFRSDVRLVYAQSFPFLKLFGWVSLPMGLSFLLSPWIGMKVEDAPWGPPAVGGIFVLLAVIFLLGCRGFTIDKQNSVASRWWGLLAPILVTRRELSTFSNVVWGLDVEEGVDRPYVAGRVSLVGDDGQTLILFKSIDTDEIRALAEQIAAFLNYPIVTTSPNSLLKNSP